jgi:uncharacterized repeat protein (TIGR03803 family)
LPDAKALTVSIAGNRLLLRELRACFSASIVILLGLMAAIAASAQTFTTLANFSQFTSGFSPNAVIQGFDGNFYGTVESGGELNVGTVFKATADGQLSEVDFDGADGSSPRAGVIQSTDGNFMGRLGWEATMTEMARLSRSPQRAQ